MNNFITPKKSGFSKIKLTDFDIPMPDLKYTPDSKAITIAKWLISWIEEKEKNQSLPVNSLLPTKNELAYFLGVSIGTIQNSLRYMEDLGYLESKQRIGTIIKDKNSEKSFMRKLTSKREIAIDGIKKFIISNKIKIGSPLPSSRILSTLIGCSLNTTRLALENLSSKSIITHKSLKNNENCWIVNSLDFNKESLSVNNSTKTLVSKVEQDLKIYINEHLKVGDKLPSHSELSEQLGVSIKTVHDALKSLINSEIILARRGRYGTTVIKLPKDYQKTQKLEKSIFSPAKDTAFYYYEKTQNAIKTMIAEHYEIGAKLPSIMELSQAMDLSPNTIRKAFQNLAKEGYLVFSRGRYGGTFVVDIPQNGNETFKWLSVNPQYSKIYNKNFHESLS